MGRWQAGSRLRRLLAHATTPLLAGLLAGLLLVDSETIMERWGIFIPAAYFVWLMFGLPGSLVHRREPRTIWYYLAWAGLFAALPLLLGLPMATASEVAQFLSCAAIAMAAGLWYWFCADWRPATREAGAAPE